jgi:hypothetical protein
MFYFFIFIITHEIWSTNTDRVRRRRKKKGGWGSCMSELNIYYIKCVIYYKLSASNKMSMLTDFSYADCLF